MPPLSREGCVCSHATRWDARQEAMRFRPRWALRPLKGECPHAPPIVSAERTALQRGLDADAYLQLASKQRPTKKRTYTADDRRRIAERARADEKKQRR